MKNDNFPLRYRSISKPKPLWNESALFGGYDYIEITDGIWVHRSLEYVFQYAVSGENPQLRNEAINEIKKGAGVFKPSLLQQSDYTKLCILLNKQTEVCINNYSYTFEQLACRFPYTKFYTDSHYTTPNFIQISTEELCKRSSTTLTLINESSYHLKPSIRNWANIIPYNANFFDDSLIDSNLLEGGNFIG